ncbi:MAG: serine/threonine protein kinase [Bacteroidaceae bacterium]|nr:serine/threonine protein kinase [Bacteroidaceae bacterium]
MYESEITNPALQPIEYSCTYTMPEKYMTTASAVLWRVRKAGKYFIIKTPKDNFGQSLALLQREYELSLGKSHPNIVNIFTYETDTIVGQGIVMEYIEGRTLTEFIAENPPFAMRRRVFMQLLNAVSYIHRCGLVHNDLKPENIIITRADNDVKLIDFGLADSDAYYLSRTLGCTPAYASPELLAQEKNIDARSDIYSLGVMMKELFGSRYSRVAGCCMQTNAAKRYSSADELISAMQRRDKAPIVALFALSVIMIFIPLVYIGNNVVQQEQHAAKEKELLMQIEQDVDSIYAVTADSLAHATYYEFACNNIVTFWESLAVYNKEHISTLTPVALYNVAAVHYTKTVNERHEKLWNVANALPSYTKSGLNAEEIIYYDSLVSRRHPYKPYNK